MRASQSAVTCISFVRHQFPSLTVSYRLHQSHQSQPIPLASTIVPTHLRYGDLLRSPSAPLRQHGHRDGDAVRRCEHMPYHAHPHAQGRRGRRRQPQRPLVESVSCGGGGSGARAWRRQSPDSLGAGHQAWMGRARRPCAFRSRQQGGRGFELRSELVAVRAVLDHGLANLIASLEVHGSRGRPVGSATRIATAGGGTGALRRDRLVRMGDTNFYSHFKFEIIRTSSE